MTNEIKGLIGGALAVVGLTAGVFLAGGDEPLDDFKCPDESYTRTVGKDPDDRVDIVVCENPKFTLTAKRNGEMVNILIFDKEEGRFLTSLP